MIRIANIVAAVLFCFLAGQLAFLAWPMLGAALNASQAGEAHIAVAAAYDRVRRLVVTPTAANLALVIALLIYGRIRSGIPSALNTTTLVVGLVAAAAGAGAIAFGMFFGERFVGAAWTARLLAGGLLSTFTAFVLLAIWGIWSAFTVYMHGALRRDPRPAPKDAIEVRERMLEGETEAAAAGRFIYYLGLRYRAFFGTTDWSIRRQIIFQRVMHIPQYITQFPAALIMAAQSFALEFGFLALCIIFALPILQAHAGTNDREYWGALLVLSAYLLGLPIRSLLLLLNVNSNRVKEAFRAVLTDIESKLQSNRALLTAAGRFHFAKTNVSQYILAMMVLGLAELTVASYYFDKSGAIEMFDGVPSGWQSVAYYWVYTVVDTITANAPSLFGVGQPELTYTDQSLVASATHFFMRLTLWTQLVSSAIAVFGFDSSETQQRIASDALARSRDQTAPTWLTAINWAFVTTPKSREPFIAG